MMTPNAPIESIVDGELRDGIVHGIAILAGTPDERLYLLEKGFTTPKHDYPMTLDTVIDAASTTKVTCGITPLLILHHRGLIDFDAPFTEYLPQYDAKLFCPVSVRQLSNHTSGFYPQQGWYCWTRYFSADGTLFIKRIMHTPPPNPPSATPCYSCWNYILIAQIIQQISGRSLVEFCQNEIFAPLGMSSSCLGTPAIGIPKERLAQTIATDAPGLISDHQARFIFPTGEATANAGLFTCANDFEKLLVCYLRNGEYEGGRLFDEKDLQEAAPDTKDKTHGYRRLGWNVWDMHLADKAFGTSLSHSGASGQTILFDQKLNKYAIVLTTRFGDYERAKTNRYRIINELLYN
ncbi:MAG: beta-lactamase family protein [Victivallales bacterium]|nr:beta-lactamase family protein [Victivallales bacterium]